MKNKVLRSAAIVLVFAFVLSLIACGKGNAPQKVNEKNTDVPIASGDFTSPSSTPVPTPAPTIDPAMYRQDEGVTRTDIEVSGIGNISPLGGGKFACCISDYEKNTTYVSIYDTVSHEVTASYDYPDLIFSLDGYMHDGGSFVCRDIGNKCCYIVDSADGKLVRVDVPDINALFSRDCKTCFYVDEVTALVMQMDVESGKTSAVDLSSPLRFLSIDAMSDDGRIVGRVSKSPYNYNYGIAVFALETGEIELLRNSMLNVHDGCTTNLTFASYGLSGVDNDENTSLVYLWEDTLRQVKLPSGTETQLEFYPIENSDYYISVRYPMDESTDPEDHGESYIYRYGDSLDRIALSEYGIEGGISNFCYMKAEELLVGFADTEDGFSVIIVDPLRCEFEKQSDSYQVNGVADIDEEVLNAYAEALNPPLESSKYDYLRKRADEIEARFSVRIMLANQGFVAFEDENPYELKHSSILGDKELARIENALDELEKALGSYPLGFFEQYKDVTGEAGLIFAFFGSISNAAAFTSEARTNQCIAFDISITSLEGTIYHEIWHTIENIITLKDPNAFSDEAWSVFNPEGFEYYNDYSAYYTQPDSGKYTYFGDRTEGVYFTDAYGRTNGKEDRARIMEYRMFSPKQAALMLEYEPLRAKYEYMCEKIRTFFDIPDDVIPSWEADPNGHK